MEYRIARSIINSDNNIVYEGENVKVTLDDRCVLCGIVGGIFDREKRVVLDCEYFTVNICVDNIKNITKE